MTIERRRLTLNGAEYVDDFPQGKTLGITDEAYRFVATDDNTVEILRPDRTTERKFSEGEINGQGGLRFRLPNETRVFTWRKNGTAPVKITTLFNSKIQR